MKLYKVAVLCTAVVALAAAPSAQATTSSGGQTVSATLVNAIAIVPTAAVTLTNIGVGQNATTSGSAVVTSNECYSVSVAADNSGKLKTAGNVSLTNALQWSVTNGSGYANMSGTAADAWVDQAAHLARTHTVFYQQPQGTDAAGVYTGTVTWTAQTDTGC